MKADDLSTSHETFHLNKAPPKLRREFDLAPLHHRMVVRYSIAMRLITKVDRDL